MKVKSLKPSFDLAGNPEEGTHDWERFLTSHEENLGAPFKGIPSRTPYLFPLFGNSSFLARCLIRHPDWVSPLLRSPYLKKEKKFLPFSREISSLLSFAKKNWLSELRQYKYRELLRITLKDLSGGNAESILNELSGLAMALLSHVDRKLFDAPPTYHILALGKLGGNELNYSSDIDLLAISRDDASHDSIIRHLQNLNTVLSQETQDGFLYRVDWDLRPEGGAGTLVNSLSALEGYYENFGAEWERQMLTKGRLGAGSPELGKKFLKMIEPFVYRKYLDVKSLDHIRQMKEKVHDDLAKTEQKKIVDGFHVKLGIGGIREVEFFAQAFLLIYGGKFPRIRTTHTLKLLDNLKKAKLVSPSDIQILKMGYLFLRKLEHRLQLVEERQTHLLPSQPREQLRTARRMGYAEKDDETALAHFQSDLKKQTQGIHRLFERLFAPTAPKEKPIFMTPTDQVLPYRERLKTRLTRWPGEEETLNEIRYFKKDEMREIMKMEKEKPPLRVEICRRLSLVAESICRETLQLALEKNQKRFGAPAHEAQLAVVAMGKLGGREINYASDLDLIFIFSENGETSGPQSISHQEYFARIVQTFISNLSLLTRAGSAYEIDTELRPSGNFGPLVTSLAGFVDYQKNASQIWEKLALLRARPLDGSLPVARLLHTHLNALLFTAPYPANIRKEIHRLRMRVEKEIARETEEVWDLKAGTGGIMDVEFILQYLQLRFGYEKEELRGVNAFDGLKRLYELEILPLEEGILLLEAYDFYRTIEAKIQLLKQRGINRISKNAPFLDEIAHDIWLPNGEELVKQLLFYRKKVRGIYQRIMVN